MALLISHNRKLIKVRYIIQLVVLEVLLAWLFLRSDIGSGFTALTSTVFNGLMLFVGEGTDFFIRRNASVRVGIFLSHCVMPDFFISALFGIIHNVNLLPIIIWGRVLSKDNGMGRLASFNAVSALLLGLSENFIVYKDVCWVH